MNESRLSTILTCLGAAGVIATGIMSAKAAPKATAMIKMARDKKGDKLTKIEKVKAAAPAYIPPVLMGASTIVCVVGSNILNKRYQASLASAYALLDRSYREYTQKVADIYGEEADVRIKSELIEEIEEDEELLFYDFNSRQYFSATIDEVLQKTVMDDGLECYTINTPYDTIPPFD